jgi:hypothetical protein
MKCDNQEVPPYLHWNNRSTYEDKDYYYFHKLYRLKAKGNPILIPEKWINAISCKWSKLVKQKHIMLQPDKKIGDEYDFVFIKEIKSYERINVLKDDHEYTGVHVLSCILKHNPLPCDFSHSEILIRHRVFKNEESVPFFDEVYSYESWESQTAMLKKMKSKFFKDLKSDFRVDMIKLISRGSSQNNKATNIKAVFNLIDWNKVVTSSL